ncbi:MAG: hypothetical protein E7435_02315 [Ruminococcaceae bacterium]|nr:hypothetical protein [Oscillospiraceae bacterium]
MEIIKKLTMDFSRQTLPLRVDAVQGDGALWLEFNLLSDGELWEIPTGTSVMVRYCLSVGTGGEYDTVDGQRAWQRQGNILRIAIAPQVCSAPGETALQVVLLQDGKQISTFPVQIYVAKAVSGSGEPENYTNLSQWLKYNTVDGELSLGLIEDRLEALEAASATHVTAEDVRQMIGDDPWGTEAYAGEMEDVDA